MRILVIGLISGKSKLSLLHSRVLSLATRLLIFTIWMCFTIRNKVFILIFLRLDVQLTRDVTLMILIQEVSLICFARVTMSSHLILSVITSHRRQELISFRLTISMVLRRSFRFILCTVFNWFNFNDLVLWTFLFFRNSQCIGVYIFIWFMVLSF